MSHMLHVCDTTFFIRMRPTPMSYMLHVILPPSYMCGTHPHVSHVACNMTAMWSPCLTCKMRYYLLHMAFDTLACDTCWPCSAQAH
jgi:hypothetical protein